MLHTKLSYCQNENYLRANVGSLTKGSLEDAAVHDRRGLPVDHPVGDGLQGRTGSRFGDWPLQLYFTVPDITVHHLA